MKTLHAFWQPVIVVAAISATHIILAAILIYWVDPTVFQEELGRPHNPLNSARLIILTLIAILASVAISGSSRCLVTIFISLPLGVAAVQLSKFLIAAAVSRTVPTFHTLFDIRLDFLFIEGVVIGFFVFLSVACSRAFVVLIAPKLT